MKTLSLEVEQRSPPFETVQVEVPGGTTLDELARWLEREFGLESGRAASFFRSGKPWDERTEFSSHGRSALSMEGVRLDRLALRPGARIVHVHDYDRPRWHEIRVRSVTEQAVTEGEGELRVLGRATPESPAGAPLASRLTAAIDGSSGRDVPPEALRAAQLVAEELLEQGDGSIERIGEQVGLDLSSWLMDLPSELARGGLVDEAEGLCTRAAAVLAEPDLLGDRAVILAAAGRKEEAQAQVTEMLARFPAVAWVAVKAGHAERGLGNLARAEEHYRRALHLEDEQGSRRAAGEHLTELLVASGRRAEALALELVLDEPEEESDEAVRGAELDETELVPAPRVGRNDPCPCGSGKKYKKCCARDGGVLREASILGAALQRAVDYLVHSEHGESARTEIGRFAGPAFAGLELGEALPLLPSEEAELFYLDWWMLDREAALDRHPTQCASLLALYLQKRRGKLDPREARVLARLSAVPVSLFRLERFDPERPKPSLEAEDLLTGARFHTPCALGVLLPRGVEHVLTRFLELDGQPTPVHSFPIESALVEPLLRSARARLMEGTSVRARAPILFQAWLDALHGAPAG